MSSCRKNGKDGQDGHKGRDGQNGKDGAPGCPGERGKRGHRGCEGADGATGPTGPCCTGPTGPAGTASDRQSLFVALTGGVCATTDDFVDMPLSIPFTITNPVGGEVDIFVSLSAELTGIVITTTPGAPLLGSVVYRVLLDAVPMYGSEAASRETQIVATAPLPTNSLEGNSIVLHRVLPAGSYTVTVQWRVEFEGQSVCIDPDAVGQHGSLLVQAPA